MNDWRRTASFLQRPLQTILALLLLATSALADDWPQWLGPQRDGVWREEGVLKSFPEGGPRVRWRAKVGSGYAGPAVANGRVYLMDRIVTDPSRVPGDPFLRAFIPGQERVLCFNEADGELIWKHEYECQYSISYPSGPRTTPTVKDGKVYTLGAEGDLCCLDAEEGEIIWSRNFKKDFGAETPVWGHSAHPLVEGDLLICMVGGAGSTVVAFNKDTGEEVWRALTAKEPGYCPPVIYEAGRARQLIVWHSDAVNSLNPETGETYWSQPIEAKFAMAIATPRKAGDYLFCMSFPDQTMLLKLNTEKPAAELVWKGTHGKAVYGIMSTPLIEDGYIYAPCADGEFRCVKLETGERVWETFAPTTGDRRARWGNVFLIKHEPSGRVFLANEKGDLIIARLSPAGYDEISRVRLLEATGSAGGRAVLWSHPAFANRNIYARNDAELISVSLAAEEETSAETPEEDRE